MSGFADKCKYPTENVPMSSQLVQIKTNNTKKHQNKTIYTLSLTGIASMEMQCLLIGEQIPTLNQPGYFDLPYSELNTKYKSNSIALKNTDADENIKYVMDQYKTLENSDFKSKLLYNITRSMEQSIITSIQNNTKLKNDDVKNKFLKNELTSKITNPKYIYMNQMRKNLPSYQKKDEILHLVHHNQVILINGETGCGKTTQICQYILDDAIMSGYGSTCRIVCTQPRRISAKSVAMRVADERVECVGMESVGYQIGLDKKLNREYGSIFFCTAGILLQHIQIDRALNNYSHIIIDEIHERDTFTDLILTFIKRIIHLKINIKLILMSATLNISEFSNYYNNCPCLKIPGFTYTVQELYLEDIYALKNLNYVPKPSAQYRNHVIQPCSSFIEYVVPYIKELKNKKMYPLKVINLLETPTSENTNYELILRLIQYICKYYNDDNGAILVFLSGWNQIVKLINKLKINGFKNTSRYVLIPLHSKCQNEYQEHVFISKPGVRKIILSTNIAETSITINDVVYVINNGRMKLEGYDLENNIRTLEEEWVSLSNAKQRRGRAGRVKPGICYNLYTRGRERSFRNNILPEIMRTNLEGIILQSKLLQVGMVTPFFKTLLSPPNPKAIESAIKVLTELNALDEKENLTPLGYHLANLPIEHCLGKMIILGTIFSCLNPILSIAVSLEHNDPFMILNNDKEYKVHIAKQRLDENIHSDHLVIAKVMLNYIRVTKECRTKEFCEENCLVDCTLKTLNALKNKFANYLYNLGFIENINYQNPRYNHNSTNINVVKCVLIASLYSNIAVLNSDVSGHKFITIGEEDLEVTIHQNSVNCDINNLCNNSLLLYHTKLKTNSIYLHDTTVINFLPVVMFAKDLIILENGTHQDVILNINLPIKFTCSLREAQCIQKIQKMLQWLINYLMAHPKDIAFNSNILIGKLIKFITDVVSAEKCPGILDYYS